MGDVVSIHAPVAVARLGLVGGGSENLVDEVAERAVLGALFLDETGASAQRVRAVLPEPRAFGRTENATVYAAMIEVSGRGEAITYATVAHALRAADRLNAVGGLQYLAALSDEIPSVAFVESHARIVAELAARRTLRDYGRALMARATDLGRSIGDVRDAAAKAIREVAVPGARVAMLGDGVAEMWQRVEDVAEGRVVPLVSSGLAPLDRVLGGGFARGKAYLLAARPRVGKTALAVQVALSVARGGGAVYVVSLEIPQTDLVRQSVACLGSVDHTRIAKAQLNADETQRAMAASNELGNLPVFVVDSTTPGCPRTVPALASAVASLPAPPDLIVLDHVGKMNSVGRYRERRDAIAEISGALCDLAKRTGAVVLTLAHITRADAERPTLEGLAEADALGKDADGVVLMHRDDLYPPRKAKEAPEKGVALVLGAKIRGAAVNEMCKLRLRGEFQRWDPIETDAPDAPRFDSSEWSNWEDGE